MRLSDATVAHLPTTVARPFYDRDAQAVGIVHLGIGAFHRAHQAWYTDAAMNAGAGEQHGRDWAILGISLRSGDVAAQLNPQDGLYTLVERSAAAPVARIVGAVRDVLVASAQSGAAIAALAAPTTHIASLTITEKGYGRAADGSLDPALAGDGSIYPLLAAGLRRREAAGLPGLTLLSCDNLADNGRQLDRLLREYLAGHDPALVEWFERECTCPATMIDRIVPATTEADRTAVHDLLGGLDDRACVVTEPFAQWVIEDRFAGPRPRWEAVGAQLVGDVAAFELAKLRMLNGAHSLLAYGGLLRGHALVHEAVADPVLRALAARLMLAEAAPTLTPAPGQDLRGYAEALLARFANPALDHKLIQIAMDGSQKLPQRWLETLAASQRAGRRCPAILTALAAWLRHVRGDNSAIWGIVDDPRAAELAAAWHQAGEAGIVEAVFGERGLLRSPWRPDDADRATIAAALAA